MRVFILSRFNTKFRGNGYERAQKRRLDRRSKERQFNPKWMEDRLGLMEQFTAPSIKSQTDKRFDWYVFVQNGTPDKVIRRIEKMGAIVITTPDDDVAAAQKVIRGHRGVIATVNLDTDDALAPTFVEEFHAHATERPGTVGFLRGMLVRQIPSAQVFTIGWKSESNPFQGLVENAMNAETIFNKPHGKIDRLIDLKRPMWLQIIHGENIDNWKLKRSKKDINLTSELSRYFNVRPKFTYGRKTNAY